MGVVIVSVLALAVGCVLLGMLRSRRSWLGSVGRFLRRGRTRRVPVPMPQEVLGTPEPASNVKLV